MAHNIRIVRITTSGRLTLETVERSAESFRGLVGGWLQCLGLPSRLGALWIHEEGKLEGLPPNPLAEFVLRSSGVQLLPGDYLAGDAFVTGPADANGNETGVTAELLELLDRLGVEPAQAGA